MSKLSFDDWDLAPTPRAADERKIERWLKSEMVKAIDGFDFGAWHKVYKISNTLFAGWLKALGKKAEIYLRMKKGVPVIVCDFVPEDIDYDFAAQIRLDDVVKRTCDYMAPMNRLRLAVALRIAADELEAARD